MNNLSRRDLIAGGIAASATAAWPRVAIAAPSAPLTSDIGRLERVLVHSARASDVQMDMAGDNLLPYADSDLAGAGVEQGQLNALLAKSGAEVIEVRDALAAAIDATRASGVFAAWLEAAFPRLDPATTSADTILGRDPATQWMLGDDGNYRIGANDTSTTMWTRDSAFMTPRGLVIGCSVSPLRRRENVLMRFLYRHSPMLAGTPIAYDALAEGMIVEGGDCQVVDANTLFMGTGNRSDPRTAPVLARKLGMDVLAVQTVKRDFLTPMQRNAPQPARQLKFMLLHLDTYFTQVAHNHALTVPYLLEQEYAESSPIVRMIRGARVDTALAADEAEAALDMMKEFGRVTLYQRGTGKKVDLGNVKLVDYLKKQGWRFTWVGGARPTGDQDAFRHFMQTVSPELQKQGANVVQATPGRVIAYDSTPVTRAALEADGIGVDTFAGRDLWPGAGGPHCLTQPLRRS